MDRTGKDRRLLKAAFYSNRGRPVAENRRLRRTEKIFSEMITYFREMKRSVPTTALTDFGKPLPRIKVTASEFNAMA
jgi:hypothetical protein